MAAEDKPTAERIKAAEEALDKVDAKALVGMAKQVGAFFVTTRGVRHGMGDIMKMAGLMKKLEKLSKKAMDQEMKGDYAEAMKYGQDKLKLIEEATHQLQPPPVYDLLNHEKELTEAKIQQMQETLQKRGEDAGA